MILGINHVTLDVSNIDRAFDFYRNAVGLRPIMKSLQSAYFLAGNDWICLNLNSTARAASRSYSHLALSIAASDFLACRERLLSMGAREFQKNRSEGDSFYFLDLDDNPLEINEQGIEVGDS